MNELQVKEISEIIAQLITGSEITMMFNKLNINCCLPNTETKWKRIYNGIAFARSHDAMVKIIEYVMTPSRFTDNQNTFTEAMDALNLKLSFIGFKLLPTGKVINHVAATTLDEAHKMVSRLKGDLHKFDIHPQILECCRPEIVSENLFHLIFEASKCVLKELQIISGLTLDGNSLINQCFDGNNPIVVMNTFQTESERSEHKGLKALLNAIVYLYRNPKAHTPKFLSQDTYRSTIEALIIISRARYALEKCFRNNTH